MKTLHRILATCIAVILMTPVGNGDERTTDRKTSKALFEGQRVVFLGDSITNDGWFIQVIETRLQMMGVDAELINLGLPSETACGLSEAAHPFPRPDVHERLDRVLEKASPDIVFACYGINDGIYHPFSAERFEAYQDGINRLIDAVTSSGVRLYLMTSPPFDALPMSKANQLVAPDEPNATYAWTAITADYDDVMQRYGNWLLDQADRVDGVIDLRTPLLSKIKQERANNPNFSLAPQDGVHLDASGHEVMANAILDYFAIPHDVPADSSVARRVAKEQRLMHAAWLSHVGHKRPGITPGLPLGEARRRLGLTQAAGQE